MTQTIEQLQARVRELEEENARLRADNIAFARNLKGKSATTGATYEHICTQLAAEQLNNKRLRDALLPMTQGFYWLKHENFVLAERLLSEPLDTSALDAYVAEKVKAARSIDEKQIAYLFEERSLLTRQRDLAVTALESIAGRRMFIDNLASNVDIAVMTLDAIKESEEN